MEANVESDTVDSVSLLWRVHISLKISISRLRPPKHRAREGGNILHMNTVCRFISILIFELEECTCVINVKHGWILLQVQFDVFDIENGVYKLNFIYKQDTGLYVHLSRAIESFVNEIVYTSISAISSTEAVCVFLVKVYIFERFWDAKCYGTLAGSLFCYVFQLQPQFHDRCRFHHESLLYYKLLTTL